MEHNIKNELNASETLREKITMTELLDEVISAAEDDDDKIYCEE